ncbi:unnamed protein product [Arctogadus glacialis]
MTRDSGGVLLSDATAAAAAAAGQASSNATSAGLADWRPFTGGASQGWMCTRLRSDLPRREGGVGKEQPCASLMFASARMSAVVLDEQRHPWRRDRTRPGGLRAATGLRRIAAA